MIQESSEKYNGLNRLNYMDYIIIYIKNHFNIRMLKDTAYLTFIFIIILMCVLLFVILKNSFLFRIKRTFLILYMNVVYSMTVLMRIGSKTVRKISMQPLFTILYYKENGSVFCSGKVLSIY